MTRKFFHQGFEKTRFSKLWVSATCGSRDAYSYGKSYLTFSVCEGSWCFPIYSGVSSLFPVFVVPREVWFCMMSRYDVLGVDAVIVLLIAILYFDVYLGFGVKSSPFWSILLYWSYMCSSMSKYRRALSAGHRISGQTIRNRLKSSYFRAQQSYTAPVLPRRHRANRHHRRQWNHVMSSEEFLFCLTHGIYSAEDLFSRKLPRLSSTT